MISSRLRGSRMPDDIVQQVIAVIARKKKLDAAQITAESTFEQLGLDSLDAADLLFTFEDTFGIVVPDEVALSMKSVGQVAVEVKKLLDEHGKSTEGVTM